MSNSLRGNKKIYMYYSEKMATHLKMIDKTYQSHNWLTLDNFLFFKVSSFINWKHKIYPVRYIIIKAQSKKIIMLECNLIIMAYSHILSEFNVCIL